MPNAFNGLGASEPYVPDYLQDEIQFRIDNDLRTIAIPADGVVLGVVGDKNVNHVNFQMPAWYNGFNMSLFQARINFIDAAGNANYYTVNDMTVLTPEGNEVVGVPSDDDIIYFTWLVDSYATGYVGSVRFNVRLTKYTGSTLSQAFNTQVNSCQVLEGIQLADEITQEQAEDLLFHYSSELGDITEGYKRDIEETAAIVIESIPDDYAALAATNGATKKDLQSISGKNLVGLRPDVFYPVYLTSGDKLTMSTADSLALGDNDLQLELYKKDKTTKLDSWTIQPLGSTASSRTITVDNHPDVYYMKFNKTPIKAVQVERGETATAYEPYRNIKYDFDEFKERVDDGCLTTLKFRYGAVETSVVGKPVQINPETGIRLISDPVYFPAGTVIKSTSGNYSVIRIAVDENDMFISDDDPWGMTSVTIETSGYYRINLADGVNTSAAINLSTKPLDIEVLNRTRADAFKTDIESMVYGKPGNGGVITEVEATWSNGALQGTVGSPTPVSFLTHTGRAHTNRLYLTTGTRIVSPSNAFYISRNKVTEDGLLLTDDDWTSSDTTIESSGYYYICVAKRPNTTDTVNVSSIDVKIYKDGIIWEYGAGISFIPGEKLEFNTSKIRAHSQKMYLEKGTIVASSNNKNYLARELVDEEDNLLEDMDDWNKSSVIIDKSGYYYLIVANANDTSANVDIDSVDQHAVNGLTNFVFEVNSKSSSSGGGSIIVPSTGKKNLCGMDASKLYPVNIKAGTTLTMSITDGTMFVPQSAMIGAISICCYDENMKFNDMYSIPPGSSTRTFSVEYDTYYVSWSYNYDVPMQLELGSDATSYEVYDETDAVKEFGNDVMYIKGSAYSVYNPYKDKKSNCYKGQIHCHTTNSDGRWSVDKLMGKYADAGYDFITISDHNIITPKPADDKGMVWLCDSWEDTHNVGGYQHCNIYGGTQVVNRTDTINNTNDCTSIMYNYACLQGAAIQYNHPEDEVVRASTYTITHMPKGFSFVEVYNACDVHNKLTVSSTSELPASGNKFYDVAYCTGNSTMYINKNMNADGMTNNWVADNSYDLYDTERGWTKMLDTGYKVFGTATDDCHFESIFNYGWINVFANTRTQAAIWNGFMSGNFYSSCGVELSDITVEDGTISISIEDGTNAVTKFIGYGGNVLKTCNGATATYEFTGNEKYVRAIVQIGFNKAWTQPVWLLNTRSGFIM